MDANNNLQQQMESSTEEENRLRSLIDTLLRAVSLQQTSSSSKPLASPLEGEEQRDQLPTDILQQLENLLLEHEINAATKDHCLCQVLLWPRYINTPNRLAILELLFRYGASPREFLRNPLFTFSTLFSPLKAFGEEWEADEEIRKEELERSKNNPRIGKEEQAADGEGESAGKEQTLSDYFLKMANNPLFSDITILFGKKKKPFFGHKAILSCRNKFFRDLFQSESTTGSDNNNNNNQNSSNPTTTIQLGEDIEEGDVDDKVVVSLLQLMYSYDMEWPLLLEPAQILARRLNIDFEIDIRKFPGLLKRRQELMKPYDGRCEQCAASLNMHPLSEDGSENTFTIRVNTHEEYHRISGLQERTSTLKDLKEKLRKHTKIPTDQQRIVFKDQIFEAGPNRDNELLCNLKMKHNDWILSINPIPQSSRLRDNNNNNNNNNNSTRKKKDPIREVTRILSCKELLADYSNKNNKKKNTKNRPLYADIAFLVQEKPQDNSNPADNTEYNGSSSSSYMDNQNWKLCFGHKCIIGRSNYLRVMITGYMMEASQEVITIPDTSSSVWRVFMDYLYTDHIRWKEYENNESPSILIDLWELSHRYLLDRLQHKCEERALQLICLDNVTSLYEYSQLFGSKRVMNACLSYIYRNYQRMIAHQMEFPSLVPIQSFDMARKEVLWEFDRLKQSTATPSSHPSENEAAEENQSKEILIHILELRTSSKHSFLIDPSSSTIADLKRLVELKFGIPIADQRLTFRGDGLVADKWLLSEYHIVDDSLIVLLRGRKFYVLGQ